MTGNADLEEELAMAPPSRKLARGLFRFIQPYRRLFLGMMGLEFLFVSARVGGPHIVKRVIDHGIPARDHAELFLLTGALVLLYVLCWLFDFIQFRTNMTAGQRILNDLRRAVFTHVQFLSMSYFDKTKAGKIISRADRDVAAMEHPMVWGPITLLNGTFYLLLSGVSMALYSWKLCLVIVALVPPLLIASEIFRRKGLVAYRRCRESLAVLTANVAESISGIKVTQAFAREARNLLIYSGLARRHADNVRHASVVWNLYSPFVRTLYVAATAVIIFYGGHLVAAGEIEVGVLAAFVLYLGMFFGPIFEFSSLFNEILHGSSAAERIFQLLETEPQVKDRPGAPPFPPIEGQVEFDHVWFRYRKEEVAPWILRDVHFTIRPGEMVAFVGPTGAGKSTIINLITRFYEPERGRILVDGLDLRDHTIESLHQQMGIVLQDNFLFSGTVFENIVYPQPETSLLEVEGLARALGAHELIARLSGGYGARVGERGTSLSQGERQLICFVRALVANPRILILDEATSSVDTVTEDRLQSALLKLVKGRTSFVVAHRLSTVRHADRIFVVERGEIVETGTHQELVRAGGRYAELHREYVRV
ncbi:MAG: ABC transporter ATP-binding protein [Planctomycetes bacterium]|nr:ABC transporter ATP-binding protein [Planctomycetota bacterium]